MTTADRRRYQRVKLQHPVRGAIGSLFVYLLDASAGGLRVLHSAALAEGGTCRVEIPSNIGPIKLDCQIVRTAPAKSAQKDASRPLFQSGLAILNADRQSAERLRALFA